MRNPIFIRPLTEDERQQIQKGLHSSDAFVLRRCQILLASARGERAPVIAQQLGCDDQTVRNAIKGFNATGLAVLQFASQSTRLWQRSRGVDLSTGRPGQFRARDHRHRGVHRKCTSRTQTTQNQLETCQTLDHQPRSAVSAKKNARDRLIAWASQQPNWAIGFQDEVWWSRFALPRLYAWQDAEHPLRLVEQSWKKEDPDPKALACYGVLWQEGSPQEARREQMWLRFVTGRPVSALTTQFLDWCCQRLLAQGKTHWLLIWDNASWHKSQAVRTWIRHHNQQVKQTGTGVRILPFLLPTQSPWLNPIEPKWVHGKRNVVEHDRLLTAKQLAERVCAYFGCSYESHLIIPEKVA